MRNLDDFFNFEKLHERVIVDSKDNVLIVSEGVDAIFIELNLSCTLFCPIRVELAAYRQYY